MYWLIQDLKSIQNILLHMNITGISVYPKGVVQRIFQTGLCLPGPNAVLSPNTVLLAVVTFLLTTVSHLLHSTALLTPKSATGLLPLLVTRANMDSSE